MAGILVAIVPLPTVIVGVTHDGQGHTDLDPATAVIQTATAVTLHI